MKHRGTRAAAALLLASALAFAPVAGLARADEREDAEASTAFARLLRATGDDVSRAEEEVVSMGSAVVPTLVEALASGDRRTTPAATEVLQPIGDAAAPATGALPPGTGCCGSSRTRRGPATTIG